MNKGNTVNHIFAKVKQRGCSRFFRLIADQTLYDIKKININLAECITYLPDYKLDEDSWFKIEQFSEQEYCIELLKNNFDTKDYNEIEKNKLANIVYLFAIQDDDFFFQRVTKSNFIRNKILLDFCKIKNFNSSVIIEKNDNDRLLINDLPDAIYFKKEDTLVFRNLVTISGIFKGIDILYREATEEETKEFLDLSFLSLKDDYNTSKVSKSNLKRIAIAMDILAPLSNEDRELLISYTYDYCKEIVNFNRENKRFEISDNDDLKYVLYGIEQRYYSTPIGKERTIANSKRPMK